MDDVVSYKEKRHTLMMLVALEAEEDDKIGAAESRVVLRSCKRLMEGNRTSTSFRLYTQKVRKIMMNNVTGNTRHDEFILEGCCLLYLSLGGFYIYDKLATKRGGIWEERHVAWGDC